MQSLLKAGVALDPVDDFGLTPIFYAAKIFWRKPFDILAEKGSLLHTFPDRHGMMRSGIVPDSILEWVITTESFERNTYYCNGVSRVRVESIMNGTISAVVTRHQTLESYV